jgi:hypothetical protein
MKHALLCILHVSVIALAGCSGSNAAVGNGGGTSAGDGNGGGSGSGGGSSSGSGSAVASSLFDTPSSTDATPDQLYGLWGGSTKTFDEWTFDIRLRLAASDLSVATRCSTPSGDVGGLAGVAVKARVNDDEITVLESKKDEKKVGDVTCRANETPGTTVRCEKEDGFQTNCFVLDGDALRIYGNSPFDKLELVKISD